MQRECLVSEWCEEKILRAWVIENNLFLLGEETDFAQNLAQEPSLFRWFKPFVQHPRHVLRPMEGHVKSGKDTRPLPSLTFCTETSSICGFSIANTTSRLSAWNSSDLSRNSLRLSEDSDPLAAFAFTTPLASCIVNPYSWVGSASIPSFVIRTCPLSHEVRDTAQSTEGRLHTFRGVTETMAAVCRWAFSLRNGTHEATQSALPLRYIERFTVKLSPASSTH